jgi:hypothetical protein
MVEFVERFNALKGSDDELVERLGTIEDPKGDCVKSLDFDWVVTGIILSALITSLYGTSKTNNTTVVIS